MSGTGHDGSAAPPGGRGRTATAATGAGRRKGLAETAVEEERTGGGCRGSQWRGRARRETQRWRPPRRKRRRRKMLLMRMRMLMRRKMVACLAVRSGGGDEGGGGGGDGLHGPRAWW